MNENNLEEESIKLAQSHFQIDDEIVAIYKINDTNSTEKQIILLEVGFNTIPMGIFPLKFGKCPQNGWNFPCTIIDIAPDEYEDIKCGKLSLPNGWTIEKEYLKNDNI